MNIRRNNKSLLSLLLFVLILITTPVSLYADTRYVSDKLTITMRRGAGGEYKIIKTLETGTPVEVLAVSGDYYKVRTKDGKEGWVLKRYVTSDTPKTIVISGLKKEIERLVEDSSDVVKIVKERDMLKEENKRLIIDKNELLQENENLSRKKVIYWFLAGGGVFLFGWIAGQISKRKRRGF